MQERFYNADDIIIVAGDPGNDAFLVRDGLVEVFLNKDDDDIVLATLGPGEIFGEMSLIDPGPRSASVRAKTPTLCVSTTFDELNCSFDGRPEIAMEFMQTLVRRLRSTNQAVIQAQPQKQLLRTVAHEFGNVLQSILGTAELAANRSDSESVLLQEDLVIILAEAQQGSILTRKLLLEARNQDESQEVANLNEVIPGILRSARSLLPCGITLACDLAEPGSRVKVNLGHLKGAIINAVINARDALAQGGEIRVCSNRCQIDPEVCENLGLSPGFYALLKIEDNGEGIPDAVKALMFKPFMTTKSQDKGTGLGMGIIRTFAEQCGGAVQVDSKLGVGTTISFYLPSP